MSDSPKRSTTDVKDFLVNAAGSALEELSGIGPLVTGEWLGRNGAWYIDIKALNGDLVRVEVASRGR